MTFLNIMCPQSNLTTFWLGPANKPLDSYNNVTIDDESVLSLLAETLTELSLASNTFLVRSYNEIISMKNR